jgi:transcriptional regulator with XRE-family HTH domain
MTQAEFAAHLGISAGFLSHLYGGTRQIGLDTMLRITERYPDLAYLFLAESVPSKSPQIEGDTL